MKTVGGTLTGTLGILVLGMMWATTARAECVSLTRPNAGASVQPQSWQQDGLFQQGSFLLLSNHEDDPIVGMWQVKFIAEGNGPGGPPDGTTIDSAFVQWHSDGTELMNSGRPPQDGNICLGVWERTGRSTYKLNHFALGNNPDNPGGVGSPAGPSHIVEDVVLSRDGKHYAGSFTLDAYDTSGNNSAHIVGKITATRITVHTPIGDVL